MAYRELSKTIVEIEEWFNNEGKRLGEFAADPINDSIALSKARDEFHLAYCLRIAMEKNIIRCVSGNARLLSNISESAKRIIDILTGEKLQLAMSYIESSWPQGFIENSTMYRANMSVVSTRCNEILSSINKFHEWLALQSIIGKCRIVGLKSFLDAMDGISVADAPEIFQKMFLRRWIGASCDKNPILREFSGVSREELIRKFEEIDLKIRIAAIKQIHLIASEPAQKVAMADYGYGDAGEIGILRRELQKRKRIKPLRKLFAEIPHVLQAIKPCLLMSPISVSTFLKPDGITFDLVVFDEASQLPTPDAIPSILRAKQVVVAGDENQLPPTSFFLASTIFDQDSLNDTSDENEPLESLLDECVAIKPVFEESKIIWHYRSRDERLINFSNHFFYDNLLITFPQAAINNEAGGVKLVYTSDGIWDKGRSRTNRVEARRVVELIVENFAKFPERTVGVVAMNAAQKEAIEYFLDDEIEKRPDLMSFIDKNRPEPFFIKSLENVQGDERDTIIISVGYGKTIDGSLSLNFGPLNRDGGWRRLNVLVTRAKYQTILVTSLQSYELSAVNPANKGATMLRNFIQYTEMNCNIPFTPAKTTFHETNDFEDGVAEALRSLGLDVDEQVGAGSFRIDLAIRDKREKSRYIMAIECDGATYHSAKTARDRDLLRHEILRAQGWKIHRLWSTDWFRDRENALKSILNSLELAYSAPINESIQANPISEVNGNNTEIFAAINDNENRKNGSFIRKYKEGEVYEKYDISKISMNHTVKYDLISIISDIVIYESPLHENILVDRLKEICGFSRAGSNILNNIKHALSIAAKSKGFLINNSGFIYKDEKRPVGFRLPAPGIKRDIELVAPEEIENSILYLVEDQFGFSKDELPKAILTLFGYGKARSERCEVINSIADKLIEQNKLRLSGFTLYLS